MMVTVIQRFYEADRFHATLVTIHINPTPGRTHSVSCLQPGTSYWTVPVEEGAHLLQRPVEGVPRQGGKSALRHPWESCQAPGKTERNKCAGAGGGGERLAVGQQEKGRVLPGPRVLRALGPLSPHHAGGRALPELSPRSPFWPFGPCNPRGPSFPGGPNFPGGPCIPLSPCPVERRKKCDPVAIICSLPPKAQYAIHIDPRNHQ